MGHSGIKGKARFRRSLLIGTLSLVSWLGFTAAASAQLARLHSISGSQVQLKRSGWTNFRRALPGTALYGDDRLRVRPGTVVVLVCPDRRVTDNVPAGDSSVSRACPDTPRRVRPTFGVSETWSAGDAALPYVISPWSGQVLTPKPLLRWNAVAGAQLYTVTLKKRDGEDWAEVWTIQSSQTTLCYPASQPALELGDEYVLQVVAENAAEASDDGEPVEIFSLISRDERADAEAAIAAVNAMDASQELKTLILVDEVYPSYKLFAQGINDLLALVESGTETTQIYRLLGDYFIRSGLELPTEQSYLKAIELAATGENLEEQVRAQWGLGTLYNRVDRPEEAKVLLRQAQQGAMALGDAKLLASIEAELP
ncbi:MAG: hypothetical protein DCF32_01620 [Leptolyngbya sp.]|nr:MAG: hypothetical protein DCF32_01620 [Leptolyngbya sp.]